jgi:hypothetical protein
MYLLGIVSVLIGIGAVGFGLLGVVGYGFSGSHNVRLLTTFLVTAVGWGAGAIFLGVLMMREP